MGQRAARRRGGRAAVRGGGAATWHLSYREAQLLDVQKPEDIVRAFHTAIAGRTDAILVGNDSVTLTNRRQVVELAAKHRLPAMYNNKEFIDAGGLMTYGVSYPDLYRRAAAFVNKIFKGVKPCETELSRPARPVPGLPLRLR